MGLFKATVEYLFVLFGGVTIEVLLRFYGIVAFNSIEPLFDNVNTSANYYTSLYNLQMSSTETTLITIAVWTPILIIIIATIWYILYVHKITTYKGDI